MAYHDPKQLEMALLPPGTPMFSEVKAKVADHPDLSHERRRDIQSGLRRVAKALARPPEEVPAFAPWLQKRLSSFAPASMGLTPKSWSNAMSDARAGLDRDRSGPCPAGSGRPGGGDDRRVGDLCRHAGKPDRGRN